MLSFNANGEDTREIRLSVAQLFIRDALVSNSVQLKEKLMERGARDRRAHFSSGPKSAGQTPRVKAGICAVGVTFFFAQIHKQPRRSICPQDGVHQEHRKKV